jgi:hypothetical protein
MPEKVHCFASQQKPLGHGLNVGVGENLFATKLQFEYVQFVGNPQYPGCGFSTPLLQSPPIGHKSQWSLWLVGEYWPLLHIWQAELPFDRDTLPLGHTEQMALKKIKTQ